MPPPRPTNLRAYRAARATHDQHEWQLLEAAASMATARLQLAEAEAAHDDAAATLARADVDTFTRNHERLRESLSAAATRLNAGRREVIGFDGPGDGDGFNLSSGRHPLLLLPVRLEARFAWISGRARRFSPEPGVAPTLLVRVFPDEIHEDAHEPELTPAETEWLSVFAKAMDLARDQIDLVRAWGDLIARVGESRAAWIAELASARRNPGRRPNRMSRPIYARLLPDRWIAYAELDGGTTVVERALAPVAEPLELGPAAEGIDWMRDFDRALQKGMALTLALPADTSVIRRLVVVGVRGTLDPTETQKALEGLLASHHYTRGLELLTPGTPSNSVPGQRAAYTSRPTLEEVFAVEGRRLLVNGVSSPLCQVNDDTDGTRLAQALGIETSTLAFVRGADGLSHRDGVRMRQLVAAAMQRRLTALFDGIFAPETMGNILGFAIEQVNGLGPFAALRVGAQPYGLLPIQVPSTRPPIAGDFGDDARGLLDQLRARFWEPATAGLDYVGKPGADPGLTLVNILRQDAVPASVGFRPVLGPQISASAVTQLTAADAAALTGRRNALIQLLGQLGAQQPQIAPLVSMLQGPEVVPLTSPFVEPPDVDPLSAQRARNYLELVASMRLDDLAAANYPADRPDTLLFAFARLAILEMADVAARELLEISMPGINMSRWDSEDVPSVSLDFYGTPQRRLSHQVTLPDPLSTIGNTTAMWFHLSPGGLHGWRMQMGRELLRALKDRPPAVLEEILRATLGTFSYRLDAWYTALATDALMHRVRADVATQSGLQVGAWGVVENVRLAPRRPGANDTYTDAANGGFIHAPSANHAAAAAVLRSIHLSHAAAGHGDAFSVDLSSRRVRQGMELLEGIRAGQPLGALLGYRIERDLLARGIPQYIATFRAVAPLVANKLTPGSGPIDAIAASNVVDGLVLLEKGGHTGSGHASAQTLWTTGNLGALPTDTTTVDAINGALARAEDLVDSVADLVLAESVYQAVQGNALRAGASADSVSGAAVGPTELDVVRTPRTGVGVTHRVLVTCGEPTYGAVGGWMASPRALAEPRLDALAQSMLPVPGAIGIRVRFRDADGDVVDTVDTTIGELHRLVDGTEAASLRLAALDIVAQADPNDAPQRTALEVRLAALADAAYPDPSHDGAIELVFSRDQAWTASRFGIVETLEIARSVRDLIGHARGLTPRDFAHPETAAGVSVHPTDLESRRAAAAFTLQRVDALLSAAQASQSTADLRRALFEADTFGIAGAAPDTLRDEPKKAAQTLVRERLMEQAAAASRAVRQRIAAADALAADDTAGRLQTLFGDSFKVVPLLVRGAADPFAVPPDGADSPAVRTWFTRAARVRKGPELLDAAMVNASAVGEAAGQPGIVQWQVTQFPAGAAERWVALPPKAGTTIPGGRVSIAAAAVAAGTSGGVFAGLFVDEWMEVVPSDAETTSVAFHCDAPSSVAPQVLLLAVPAPEMERWTPQTVRNVVLESLALSRLRLVDNDILPSIGQLLPALVSLENPAGEAASLGVDTLTDPPPS